MKIHAIILILLKLFTLQVTSSSQYCYSKDKNPYRGFSFPTTYDFVRGNFSELTPTPKSCKIQHIWFVARHGARYPSLKTILQMNFVLPKIRNHLKSMGTKPQSMCNEDYQLLKNWHSDPVLTKENAMQLVRQGAKDHVELGKRVRRKFSKFLNYQSLEHESRRFKVRSSNTRRTIASMYAFMRGCFESEAFIEPEKIPEKDCLLRGCRFKKRTSPINYARKYRKSASFQNMVENVIKRWSLESLMKSTEFERQFVDYFEKYRLGISYDVKTTVVLTLHSACASETAIYRHKLSPWCAAFVEEDLRKIEYYLDLRQYRKYGHGKTNNKEIGFPLLNDMVQKFEYLEKHVARSQPKGTFYFTHDNVLLPLNTAMGFFKDREMLTHENYCEMKNRVWKTSNIAPFTGNLIAEFYSCPMFIWLPWIPYINEHKDYKVRFYVNEKAVKVEGCDKDLCDWRILKKKFKQTLGLRLF